MNGVAARQFQVLTDIDLVWRFMTEVYDRDRANGMAAPFLNTR